jgi:hypothetical protein
MKKHLREYRPELSRKSVDEIRREMALYRAALRPRQTWWERNIKPCTTEDVVAILLFLAGVLGGATLAWFIA